MLLALLLAAAPYTVVLGVAQDGGLPHAGCTRSCCAAAWDDPGLRQLPASLGIVDPDSGQRWMVDASPALPAQMRALGAEPPAGVLLTHAHIGHYLGLAHLGREVMGARELPVWAMPRMATFLRENGPWSQLVSLGNIALQPIAAGVPVALGERVQAEAFVVPHRDEFSETVGYLLHGPERTVAWLPDIDKWERWSTPIEQLLAQVDVAYLDGTFFAEGELQGRPMAEVPHPFVSESMARFAALPETERAKVRFVHLNHSNPALDPHSEAAAAVRAAGMAIAREGERVEL